MTKWNVAESVKNGWGGPNEDIRCRRQCHESDSSNIEKSMWSGKSQSIRESAVVKSAIDGSCRLNVAVSVVKGRITSRKPYYLLFFFLRIAQISDSPKEGRRKEKESKRADCLVGQWNHYWWSEWKSNVFVAGNPEPQQYFYEDRGVTVFRHESIAYRFRKDMV